MHPSNVDGRLESGMASREIALASPRQYIAFHLKRSDVREAFEEPLAEQDMGKGCKIC